jgi:hypothetical protein
MKKLLRFKDCAAREDISLRQFQRRLARGEGPPVVQLGPRTFRVLEEDHDEHLRARRKLPPGYESAP